MKASLATLHHWLRPLKLSGGRLVAAQRELLLLPLHAHWNCPKGGPVYTISPDEAKRNLTFFDEANNLTGVTARHQQHALIGLQIFEQGQQLPGLGDPPVFHLPL